MSITNACQSGSQPIDYCSPFSYQRYLNIPKDSDYITLCFGINDARLCTVGSINDITYNTFYGAWNIVLEWILTNIPYAKVGILILGREENDFYRAILDIGKKWGIPVLDMIGDENITPIIDSRVSSFGYSAKAKQLRKAAFDGTTSDTHPGYKGHQYMSSTIEHFMRSL